MKITIKHDTKFFKHMIDSVSGTLNQGQSSFLSSTRRLDRTILTTPNTEKQTLTSKDHSNCPLRTVSEKEDSVF